MDKTKKTKKSKHGKKNWRKNIDVTDIEENVKKINKEKIVEKTISNLKDDELFTFDTTKPTQKYLGRKKERKEKKVKKVSKNEQRQIKRIIENKAIAEPVKQEEVKKENLDLWGDDNETKPSKKIEISYPIVPLPHPGQSYNPNKEDLSKLLHKVVDLNKKVIEKKEPKKKEKVEIRNLYESDEESDDQPLEHPVANNPATTDENRKTRKEKRLREIKKMNILKNKQALEKKKARLELHNSLSTKKILKEQKKIEAEKAKKAKEEKEKELKRQSLIRKGIIEDKELLEDFQVKKDPVPLRKLKTSSNFLSDRWENVIKRNVLGKYTRETSKKKNRKLNKIQYLDVNGATLDYNPDEPLKIIE